MFRGNLFLAMTHACSRGFGFYCDCELRFADFRLALACRLRHSAADAMFRSLMLECALGIGFVLTSIVLLARFERFLRVSLVVLLLGLTFLEQERGQ